MIPKIKTIKPLDDFLLFVSFDDGKNVVYDLKEDIATIPDFKALDTVYGMWKQAQLDSSRTCVYWNDRIDLPSDAIYEYGKEMESSSMVAEPQAEYNATYSNMEQQPTLNAHNKDEFPPAHTAEHLLNQTMGRMFGCERSRNSHIERKKSKINFLLEKEPTQEQIVEIESKINELIAADLPVTFEFVTRDNLPEGVTLAKLPENASDTLRIVRIGDYDVCACLGTHVKSTREIGNFRITSTSFNEGSFRIVFRVGENI